jgi:CubicO group peptidase (beta-lactamase class C family)
MDVTQRPFPDLMRSLVLEPAGMAHSGYLQPLPHSLRAAAASGHLEDGTPVPDGYFVYPELAAAGLWSTAGDLAALGMTVMQTLRGKETGLGLTPATLASMFEPPPHSQCANNGYLGLGWFCAGAAETLCVSHAGENEGFISHLVLMPAKGAGIAIMANSLAGWPLIDHLVDAAGFNPASI